MYKTQCEVCSGKICNWASGEVLLYSEGEKDKNFLGIASNSMLSISIGDDTIHVIYK